MSNQDFVKELKELETKWNRLSDYAKANGIVAAFHTDTNGYAKMRIYLDQRLKLNTVRQESTYYKDED